MISVKPIPSPLARLRYLWPFFFLLAALCYPQTSLLASRVSPAAPSASSKGAMSFIHSGAE
ncbi:MAG: hypothetical protein NZM04_01750, partial [Methylacidiphilales bacterium]|nr:hypothetical protein [Candidatus Methylacidiphilales bacterium]